jgi:hypothetical protein
VHGSQHEAARKEQSNVGSLPSEVLHFSSCMDEAEWLSTRDCPATRMEVLYSVLE